MSVTGWKEATPFKKYPAEKLTRTIDADAHIPDSATVTAVEVKIYDYSGTETTSSMLAGTPSVAAATVFQVQAGTAGTDYLIKAKFTLSNNDIVRLILPLQVIAE